MAATHDGYMYFTEGDNTVDIVAPAQPSSKDTLSQEVLDILNAVAPLNTNAEGGGDADGLSSFCCQICNKVFKTEVAMHIHIAKLHRGAMVRGVIDRRTDPTEILAEPPDKWCEICRVLFKDNDTLIKHRLATPESQYGGGLLVCRFCENSFLVPTDLLTHAVTMHSLGTGPPGEMSSIICVYCGFSFMRQKVYQKHMIEKHGLQVEAPSMVEQPAVKAVIKCRTCDDVFNSRETLAQHITKEHDIPAEQAASQMEDYDLTPAEHYCSECNKILRGYPAFQKHYLMEHQQKFTHNCIYCNESINVADMRTHIQWSHRIEIFDLTPELLMESGGDLDRIGALISARCIPQDKLGPVWATSMTTKSKTRKKIQYPAAGKNEDETPRSKKVKVEGGSKKDVATPIITKTPRGRGRPRKVVAPPPDSDESPVEDVEVGEDDERGVHFDEDINWSQRDEDPDFTPVPVAKKKR